MNHTPRINRPATLLVLGGLLVAGILAITALAAAAARAGDWPQILGPHRTGAADEERLADNWPPRGPRRVWKRPVGDGFAGVAVAGGRLVVFHRLENEETAEALDAATGKTLWKAAFPTRFNSPFSSDHGPRAVPVIHDGRVYLFGAEGNLHGVSLAGGEKKWSRALFKEYDAPEGYFGAGSTPIVEGDKLLVNVGGARQGAGLVALALDSGQTIWKATDELASYSSPVAATIGGTRHVIFVTRFHLMSVDPADGKVRFRIPFGKRGPTVNAASPVLIGPRVFVTSSYGIGSLLAKIGPDGAETVWSDTGAMASQYTTGVLHKGLLYGVDGRQDAGVARLVCIDPLTGKEKWSEDRFGMATLILADEKLLVMKTDGTLLLARPSPDGLKTLATAQITPGTCRALPALSRGRLYVRDTDTLHCLDLAKQK